MAVFDGLDSLWKWDGRIVVFHSSSIEPAKLRKSKEIGEGEEENNKIYVLLEKSNKNISVFLDKMA